MDTNTNDRPQDFTEQPSQVAPTAVINVGHIQCMTSPARLVLQNSFVGLSKNNSAWFWKIRIFKGPNKQELIMALLTPNKFTMLGLFENKVVASKLGEIHSRVGSHWAIVTNATKD